jgi:hypothetical protein
MACQFYSSVASCANALLNPYMNFFQGDVTVTFKQLFDDDAVANSLESLAGCLKAAKRKKVLEYGPELLLQVNLHVEGFVIYNLIQDVLEIL